MKIEFKYLVFCVAVVSGIENGKGEGSVEDFIGNFTSLLNEGYANYPTFRQKEINDQYLNTIQQHFSNLQNGSPLKPNNNRPGSQQNGQNGSPLRPNNYPAGYPDQGLPGPPIPPDREPPPPPGRPFPGFPRPPFGPQGPQPGFPGPGDGFLPPGGPQRPPFGPQGPQPGFPDPGDRFPPPGGPQRPPFGPQGPQPGFPGPGDGFPPPRPPFGPQGPEPGYPGPGFPGGGGRPGPYPPVYRPPFGSYPYYPPNSFIGALESISRYDDLRCVPRLLCEVTASRRPDGPYKQEGQLPFVSKEVLITLLTVLNFVDDSPILSFARAALLGYSSRGDLRSCLTAYPTCPRDPDQLVNYLNNHNGGFFRFFNQQLYQQPQYVPQYLQLADAGQQSIQPKLPKFDTNSIDTSTTSTNGKIYKVKSVNYQPSSGFSSRILNDPINIEVIPTSTTPAYQNRYPRIENGYVRRHPKTILFKDESTTSASTSSADDSDNFVFPVRTGRKFSFPDRSEKAVKSTGMIFPDRTGTGNLILSADSQGNYKVIFAQENYDNRKGKVRFFDNERVMKFPDDE